MSVLDPTSASAAGTSVPVLVWDLPLRVFHWTLVLAVSGAFLTQWIGDAAFAVHMWCGYAVLVLVVFRLMWGAVGPKHARFVDFIRGPRAVLRSLSSLTRAGHVPRVGHTLLGGWMILLLLAIVGTQATLGLFSNDEITETGPLMGYVSAALSRRLSGWHVALSNVILAAVLVHVAAACFYRLVLRDDLIGPMISGHRRGVSPGEGIASQRLWLAIVLLAGAAVLLWWIIRSAPEPPLALM